QVPAGRSMKDCGSASTVDCPLQLWLPALQSFWPALATPKHFSVAAFCWVWAVCFVSAAQPVSARAVAIAVATMSVDCIVSPLFVMRTRPRRKESGLRFPEISAPASGLRLPARRSSHLARPGRHQDERRRIGIDRRMAGAIVAAGLAVVLAGLGDAETF